MIKLKKLVNSFKFSFRGFITLIKKEQNFKLHTIIALIVVFFGFYFKIPLWQWSLVVLLIATIFILEMFNSVMERLMDMLQPRVHQYVAEIKDIMSAIVLVAAVASAIIGLIIFLPYLLN